VGNPAGKKHSYAFTESIFRNISNLPNTRISSSLTVEIFKMSFFVNSTFLWGEYIFYFFLLLSPFQEFSCDTTFINEYSKSWNFPLIFLLILSFSSIAFLT